MSRRKDATNKLAIWFITEILETSWDYRSGPHRAQLAKARDLVNPKRDPVTGKAPPAYTIEEVKEAIIALRDGTASVTEFLPFEIWAAREGWKRPHMIRSLGILFTQVPGTGDTFIEAILKPPDPPLKFHSAEFAEWVKQHGKRALERGLWSGLFPWLPSDEPITCDRLTYDELREIVGEDLAAESLAIWEEAVGPIRPRS